MQHPTFYAAPPPALHPAEALPVLGVAAAAVALVLMVKRRSWRRTQSLLLFVTGLSLAGAAGTARAWLEHLWTRAGSTATDKLLGTAVPWALALVIVLWWVLDMDFDGLAAKVTRKSSSRSNRHQPTVLTPWLGLLVPVALASVPFLTDLPATVQAALR